MSLIHNLRIWQKFVLLGVISLLLSVPLATMVIGAKRTEAALARQEADGLEPADALLQLLQVTQQHRGLSAGFLSGNAAMGAQREERQRDVDARVARVVQTLSRYERPALRERREAIVAGWQGLPAAVAARALTPAESFARHTALIELQTRALEEVLDASAMALDPEAATYYLMQAVFIHLPPVAEILGQLRARGTSALSASALPPAERVWVQLKQQSLRETARALQEAFRRAQDADQHLSAGLTSKVKAATEALDAVIALTDRVLLAPDVPAYDASLYFKEVTDAVDRQFALAADTFAAISTVLNERAATAERATIAALAGFALAIVCSGWLILAMSRRSALGVRQAVDAAQALAEGDLTHRLEFRARDEIGEIASAIDRAMVSLSQTIAQVLESMEAVAAASAQIAQGNADLSARTEQQACSLEETAASMGQMTEAVEASADSAQQANRLAANASDIAGKGGAVVAKVVETMASIRESSRRIADITGVIDGLAFQTNILALNASVEAARAGTNGRGFAVVAAEVRNLAQRSAQAAGEIRTLIGASVGCVEDGSTLVDEAGRTIGEVVGQVRNVTGLIAEVTDATRRQSLGIREVNAAMSQLDASTQQNAALVEESTAAARMLHDQAERMAQVAKSFRIDRTRALRT